MRTLGMMAVVLLGTALVLGTGARHAPARANPLQGHDCFSSDMMRRIADW